jgi:hypothetical protein
MLMPGLAFIVGRGVAAAELLADAEEARADVGDLRAAHLKLLEACATFLRSGSLDAGPRTPPRAWAERALAAVATLPPAARAACDAGAGGARLWAGGWWRTRGDEARATAQWHQADRELGRAAAGAGAALGAKVAELARQGARLRGGDLDALADLDAALKDGAFQSALAAETPPPPAPPPSPIADVLARILALPPLSEDNALRARLADLIAATDPLRAELIRVQLELHALRRQPVRTARFDELLAREGELVQAYGAAWSPIARGVDGIGYRRGLVGMVALPARDFLDHGRELYGMAPITEVALRAPLVADELFASPLLARLRRLGLDGLDDDGAARLAASPHARDLVALDVVGGGVGARGLEALATLPSLRLVTGVPGWRPASSWPPLTDADAMLSLLA